MGLFKELPDEVSGLVLAAFVWFGFCFVYLAPRAMDHTLDQEVYPSCMTAARAEADRKVAAAKARKTVEDMTREFLPYFKEFIPTDLIPTSMPTSDLRDVTSKASLMATCTCAASKALAGKRLNHAISLATFRLVEADDIAGLKGEIIGIVGGGMCSA